MKKSTVVAGVGGGLIGFIVPIFILPFPAAWFIVIPAAFLWGVICAIYFRD